MNVNLSLISFISWSACANSTSPDNIRIVFTIHFLFPFRKLPEIGYFYTTDPVLTSVPAFKSDRLMFLDLSLNKITTFEFEKWETPNLMHLNLSTNALTSVPNIKSDSLTILDLSRNLIKKVEFDKWDTPELSVLKLDHNALVSLPAFNSDHNALVALPAFNSDSMRGRPPAFKDALLDPVFDFLSGKSE